MTDKTTIATRSATPGRRHIAVCPFPFSSHPRTLFLLSHKIAASAPADTHISFFTTESAAAALTASMSTSSKVRIHSIPDKLPAEGNKAALYPMKAMIGRSMEAVEEGLRKSIAAAEEQVGVKIGCVVVDGLLSHVGREIAEEKAVKWVALWVSSAVALAAHMHTDYLRTRFGSSLEEMEAHKDETLDQYLLGFPSIPIIDLPHEVIRADLSSDPVARVLHLMSLNLPKAAAVIMNTFHHLESAASAALNADASDNKLFLCGGPYPVTLSTSTLGAEDQHGCLPWLDSHLSTAPSVLYISFGTFRTPEPEEFTGLAEALEELAEVNFLWVVPDRIRGHLPEGFIERATKSGKGKVVPWAPQMSVLRHPAVGAQLTHCGWMSVMESIMTQVPMICRGYEIADHMLNLRLVESMWGIGVEVEGGKMTKAAVAKAVEKVLLGEEGRKMREKMGVMKRQVEEATTEPHGSSVEDLNKFISIILN